MLRSSVLIVAAMLAGSVPVLAQTAPAGAPAPTPRCGGLLCDIGLLGGPVAGAPGSAPDATALPCHDFLCRAFGGGRDEAVAPPPEQVAVEPDRPAKTRHARAKPKVRTAKADPAKSDTAKSDTAKSDAAKSGTGGAK